MEGLLAGGDDEPVVRAFDDDHLEVLDSIDAGGDDASLILRTVVERPSSKLSPSAGRHALLVTIVTAVLLLLSLHYLLRRAVVEPGAAVARGGAKPDREDPSELTPVPDREHEIGAQPGALDELREQLATAETALAKMARQAGQSEISSGLLHNIGNVLNSVNISSVTVAKLAEDLAVGDLEAMNQILAEHANDLARFMTEDERGRHFPPFLDARSNQIAEGRTSITEEITSLSEGLARIRDMISSQQDYVRRGREIEHVAVDSLIRNALQLSERVQAFGQDLTLEVDLAPLPEAQVDRHELLEILVNLIQNARQAMETSPGVRPRLSISLGSTGDDQVWIEVADTGCGIAEENLARVFDCGFTTKPTGNGFGLHTAARSAIAMGGTLEALSDGPGAGATFRLQFPLRLQAECVEYS